MKMKLTYMNLPVRDKNWETIAQKLYRALVYKRHYEEVVGELSEQLKHLSEGEPSRGRKYIYKFHDRKGSIDYCSFIASLPGIKQEQLEIFRKPNSKVWTLIKI